MVRRLIGGEILKQSSEEGYLMNIRTIGIDLGKSVFHLVGLNEQGAVVVKKRLSRAQLLRFLVNTPAALVGMEACAGSHGIGRLIRDYGHDVKLIPAQLVRPFVKSNRTTTSMPKPSQRQCKGQRCGSCPLNGRPTRFAGTASRARPARRAPHRRDQ